MAKSFVGMNGFNPNEYAKFDNGINVYTCITTENNHALTGNGNNIKFIADAPYNEGDTITVNGETVSAQTQDGQPLQTGVWATGATVVCYLNGTTLNLRGGGGKVTVTGLSADVVKKDATITVKQGTKVIESVTGTFQGTTTMLLNVNAGAGPKATATITAPIDVTDVDYVDVTCHCSSNGNNSEGYVSLGSIKYTKCTGYNGSWSGTQRFDTRALSGSQNLVVYSWNYSSGGSVSSSLSSVVLVRE